GLEQSLGSIAQIASYISEFGKDSLFRINSASFTSNLDLLGSESIVMLTADITFMGKQETKTFAFDLRDSLGSFKNMSATLRPDNPNPSVDSIPPTTSATAPQGWQKTNFSVELNAFDNPGGLGVDFITYSATGAQAINSTKISGNKATVEINIQGTTTVSFYATDKAGNAELVKMVKVYLDMTAPTVKTDIPADRRVDPGKRIQITATDNSGGSGVKSITYSASGTETITRQTILGSTGFLSLALTGETKLTITATDKSGNNRTITQDVIVKDIEPPIITPPDNIIAEATAPLSDVNIGTATATDNVGVVSITNDLPPAGFPLGRTSVTWTAEDAAGNKASAKQWVTVIDTTPPELTIPADIEDFEATGPLTPVQIGQASATDLVGVFSLANNAPVTYSVGTTVVEWIACDAAENCSSAWQLVTVVDTTPPAITLTIEPTSEPYTTEDNIEVQITVADLVDADPDVILTHNSPRYDVETDITPGMLNLFVHAGQNSITLTATDMY
ncbi:MAG: HYR domain-containing protein, partial [Candidatus Electrothrix sp. AR4]|nr:HYR domain-containing protein [Candidatus Electrothrix sp. AR4]